MKNKLLASALLSIMTMAASVQAAPTYMVGVVYNFNGEFGFTAKALSNDKEDEFVATVGASFYPYASQYEQLSVDVGVGYTFDDAIVGVGWDFLNNILQLNAGFADLRDDKKSSSPEPEPASTESETSASDAA